MLHSVQYSPHTLQQASPSPYHSEADDKNVATTLIPSALTRVQSVSRWPRHSGHPSPAARHGTMHVQTPPTDLHTHKHTLHYIHTDTHRISYNTQSSQAQCLFCASFCSQTWNRACTNSTNRPRLITYSNGTFCWRVLAVVLTLCHLNHSRLLLTVL